MQWRFCDFQFGVASGVAMVLAGGIEPELLQVSQYQLYCHREREIKQDDHTAQTVNRWKFNENTQNMHAKKSIVYSKPAH